MSPLALLIGEIIYLYNIVLFAWIILSWLISFQIVNRYQPVVYKLEHALSRLTEPALRPIRRLLPDVGIDISPIILILLLNFLRNLAYTYL